GWSFWFLARASPVFAPCFFWGVFDDTLLSPPLPPPPPAAGRLPLRKILSSTWLSLSSNFAALSKSALLSPLFFFSGAGGWGGFPFEISFGFRAKKKKSRPYLISIRMRAKSREVMKHRPCYILTYRFLP